jgi:hypothetical protein
MYMPVTGNTTLKTLTLSRSMILLQLHHLTMLKSLQLFMPSL